MTSFSQLRAWLAARLWALGGWCLRNLALLIPAAIAVALVGVIGGVLVALARMHWGHD